MCEDNDQLLAVAWWVILNFARLFLTSFPPSFIVLKAFLKLTTNETEKLIGKMHSCLFLDPLGQTTITAGRDNCFCTCRPSVRPYVPTFQNLAEQNKKCSLLTRLWVWPSGSLMTPILSFFLSCPSYHTMWPKFWFCGEIRYYSLIRIAMAC